MMLMIIFFVHLILWVLKRVLKTLLSLYTCAAKLKAWSKNIIYFCLCLVISVPLNYHATPPDSLVFAISSYALFPLLLLLDAAVGVRSQQKVDSGENIMMSVSHDLPHRVSDGVAEGVLQCLEELLKKCHLGSVEQVV